MQQAAQDLAESGEAGLATFSSENATSAWKDSYTFVLSCEGGTAVGIAHPIRRSNPESSGFGQERGDQVGIPASSSGHTS